MSWRFTFFQAFSFAILIASFFTLSVRAYDDTCNDNLVTYWGQNSEGATNNNKAVWQQPLSFYCNDDTVDTFPIAFVDQFQGAGGLPVMDLANICNNDEAGNNLFDGTALLNCSFLASDIKACQAKGKTVTISLGGATGGGTPSTALADTIWNIFLGGQSDTRPFGDAVLDGVDLDIEGGSNSYADFVTQLRSHFNGADKQYYITGAPQCPFPDAAMGSTLNAVGFDALYVQFYNNVCGLNSFSANQAGQWNFGVWDYWARNVAPNPNVKIFIGAPASQGSAGQGYVPIDQLTSIIQNTRSSFPSFGGVMFWDISTAYANNRFDQATKAALTSGGSCGKAFTYPACNAPAYDDGTNYQAGAKVTYQNYIWEARYGASGPPVGTDDGNAWRAMSACGGPPTSSNSTSTTSSSPSASNTPPPSATSRMMTITLTSTKTVSASNSIISHGGGASVSSHTGTASAVKATSSNSSQGTINCDGIAAWEQTMPYGAGTQVTYNGDLWQANWWSEADVPGGVAQDWTNLGTCGSNSRRAFRFARCGLRMRT